MALFFVTRSVPVDFGDGDVVSAKANDYVEVEKVTETVQHYQDIGALKLVKRVKSGSRLLRSNAAKAKDLAALAGAEPVELKEVVASKVVERVEPAPEARKPSKARSTTTDSE